MVVSVVILGGVGIMNNIPLLCCSCTSSGHLRYVSGRSLAQSPHRP